MALSRLVTAWYGKEPAWQTDFEGATLPTFEDALPGFEDTSPAFQAASPTESADTASSADSEGSIERAEAFSIAHSAQRYEQTPPQSPMDDAPVDYQFYTSAVCIEVGQLYEATVPCYIDCSSDRPVSLGWHPRFKAKLVDVGKVH